MPSPQRRSEHRAHPLQQLRGLGRAEAAQARHQRHHDVGQDRHLEQPDVGVGHELQRRRPLSHEQAQGHARADTDRDLARSRHAVLGSGGRLRRRARPGNRSHHLVGQIVL